jgi:hypothetical protein
VTAVDVSVGPVINPDGITFVDGGGHLVTIGSNLAPTVRPGHI